jgi:hypothetical protein
VAVIELVGPILIEFQFLAVQTEATCSASTATV